MVSSHVLCVQDGSTALAEASFAGSLEIVNRLLSAGAAVDEEDEVEYYASLTYNVQYLKAIHSPNNSLH